MVFVTRASYPLLLHDYGDPAALPPVTSAMLVEVPTTSPWYTPTLDVDILLRWRRRDSTSTRNGLAWKQSCKLTSSSGPLMTASQSTTAKAWPFLILVICLS